MTIRFTRLFSGAVLLGAVLLLTATAHAQMTRDAGAPAAAPRVVSCNEFLVAQFEIRGQQIGQSECKMIETDFTFLGRKFRRMDMGITGTIDGFAPKGGRYNHYFSANPEFNIEQSGNKAPIFYGIGQYDMNKGNAVIFIYPLDKSTWNGKEFVTAHGAGVEWNDGKGSLKSGTRTWTRRIPCRTSASMKS